MSTTWLLIIIVVLAAGVLYALYQRNARGGHRESPPLAGSATRDYTQERETARLAHLSEEDRAWESASLQRHQANQAALDAPAERAP